MCNPMTTDYVRSLHDSLSPLQLAFLDAVNDFAYETSQPLESELGEYAREKFSKAKLVEAIGISIRKLTVNKGERVGYHRLNLVKAIADAGFDPSVISTVEDIAESEAIKIIDQTSSLENGREVCHIRNGHHGRQYVAAFSVEEVVRKLIYQPV